MILSNKMHVRPIHVRGKAHYNVVEDYYQNGRKRQRVLAHLGPHKTIEAALVFWKNQEQSARTQLGKEHAREIVHKLSQLLPPKSAA